MAVIYREHIDDAVLRRLQLTQQEILDEIVRICESNDIHYYLVGGTLLGAVRHKGFIPWDDDLDIAMPRQDYVKFCDLCRTQLDPGYFLHNIETDDNYWLIFAKVRKKGTAIAEEGLKHLDTEKGIYVDIFPFDDAPEEKKCTRTKVIKTLANAICFKRGVILPYTKKQKMVGTLLRPFSIKFLTRVQMKLMLHHANRNCPYYINYGSGYDPVKQTIPKDKYEPCKLAEFEGKMYRVPNDADYVLRRIYNDYMQLPPVEKRVLRHKPDYIDFGE
ncbi:MAG: LicD family protein [Oscillospiraceae bacterium]|nr:LicD family protein [Oscillospiraceae bacterium]